MRRFQPIDWERSGSKPHYRMSPEESENQKRQLAEVEKAKSVDTTQKEPNPVECDDGDATGTTLEEQTDENMETRRKASYRYDRKADFLPERRSSCDDEQEEKAHGRRRGSHRDSESGQKASDKRKGSLHEDESREKTAQRILRRRKRRDNVNADYGFPLSIGLDTALRACDRLWNHPKGRGR